MLNVITIMGRMTKDPELRTTTNGKEVANFTLAVDRDQDRETADFFECVAWGEIGKFICRNFHKGKMAAVVGSMQSRKWDTREGDKRISWEIIVRNVYFCGDKKQDGQAQMDGGPAPYRVENDTYGSPLDDSDIPF